MSYNLPFEEEFELGTTIEQMHNVLEDKCRTYIITNIRFKL
jgi:hypothetical protein